MAVAWMYFYTRCTLKSDVLSVTEIKMHGCLEEALLDWTAVLCLEWGYV